MAEARLHIAFIGAGRLAYHLAQALHQQGHKIELVFSRQHDNAQDLAEQLGAMPTHSLDLVPSTFDLYILAVPDQAIGSVAAQLAPQIGRTARVVHTSGGTPSRLLAQHFRQYGVFYPLQTFTKEKAVNFSQVPIAVHANSSQLLVILEETARQLTEQVFQLDDQQRSLLHLAAVFANNFSNHLFDLAQQLLATQDMSFDLLRNIILETARKVQDQDPAQTQTGPALRGDKTTIRRHLQLLADHPEWMAIYRLLTHSINPDVLDDEKN